MLSRLVHDNQFRIISMLDQRNHPAQGVTQHRLAIERANHYGDKLAHTTLEPEIKKLLISQLMRGCAVLAIFGCACFPLQFCTGR
jgi:hypothetical protein